MMGHVRPPAPAYNPDGRITCVSDHPNSFEWCINAPAIDSNGVVYANSEDGRIYAINQGRTVKESLFLKLVIGAYTPLAIGRDGLIYTENDGRMFVIGTGNNQKPGKGSSAGTGRTAETRPLPPETD